jgi:hypothetical protein
MIIAALFWPWSELQHIWWMLLWLSSCRGKMLPAIDKEGTATITITIFRLYGTHELVHLDVCGRH